MGKEIDTIQQQQTLAKNEDAAAVNLPGIPADLTNWSMTERSPCLVFQPQDSAGISQALARARTQRLTVIPHGAGHSFTDAALNTNGVIIDLTGMRHILSWDPQQGIMQVEPGVTLRDVARTALADGWWPVVTPSTAEATIGGCAAMNVTGKNAWKCGSFGEHILSLTVLLASGQVLTLSPVSNPQLFQALVGSAGLLGIITSMTLQLRRVMSGSVKVHVRPAASMSEILAIFQEEQSADFLEALVDGFTGGSQLGRGIVTCTRYSDTRDGTSLLPPMPRVPDRLAMGMARCGGTICRPIVKSVTRLANRVVYWRSTQQDSEIVRQSSLFHSTFYPPAAYTMYQAILPQGVESFQAFIPRYNAEALFTEILRRSQASQLNPLLCVIKQHRPDPFLLSYQVDGFALEAYYHIVPQTAHILRKMLRDLMDLAIAAGGRFYLAKDALLTPALYRQSVGDAAVEAFLRLKRRYDPDMLFQSDLFRRVFTDRCQTEDDP